MCVCAWVKERDVSVCVSRQFRWISILISTSVSGQSYYRKGGQKGHFTTSPSPVPRSPSIPLSLSLRRQINHISNASWKPNFFFFLPLLNSGGGVSLSFTPSSSRRTHPQRHTFSLSSPLLLSLLVLERLMCLPAAKDVLLHPRGRIYAQTDTWLHTNIPALVLYECAQAQTTRRMCTWTHIMMLKRPSPFLKMFFFFFSSKFGIDGL